MSENKFRKFSEKENIPYWDMDKIVEALPMLWRKSRSKHNGERTYIRRTAPGVRITRGEGRWADGFIKQDNIKMQMALIEALGNLPKLCLHTLAGKLILSEDLVEFFIANSQIAGCISDGWVVEVE